MNFHAIPVRRFLGHWAIVFVLGYAFSLFLFTVSQIVQNAAIFIAMMVEMPLLYLLFSWLYFRKVAENNWGARLVVAVGWIALTLLGTALLMGPVYGYPWTDAFSMPTIRGQAVNLVALLVGGWAAKR